MRRHNSNAESVCLLSRAGAIGLLLLIVPLAGFWAGCAHAQPFADPRRRLMLSIPPRASSIATPLSVPGITLWYVSSDSPSSGTISDAIDRIQGIHATQATAAKQPSASSSGWGFSGSQFLTVTNVGFRPGAGDCMFWIFSWNHQTSWGYWIADELDDGLANPTSDTVDLLNIGGAFPISTAHTLDMIISETAPSGTTAFYTNGITVATGLGGAAWINPAHPPITIGCDNFGQGIKGTLLEFALYTNATFSSNSIYVLHRYATNTYGFTP